MLRRPQPCRVLLPRPLRLRVSLQSFAFVCFCLLLFAVACCCLLLFFSMPIKFLKLKTRYRREAVLPQYRWLQEGKRSPSRHHFLY
mgnify:CR=1 FL=1